MKINSFKGEYYYLSNFYHPCLTWHDDLLYLNSEAAYQAAKTLDKTTRAKFQGLTPWNAKKLGRQIKMREDWDQVKLQIMWEVIWSKFMFHPYLKFRLAQTGEEELTELNNWGDSYWGVCDGQGENHLGRLLMELRKILQKEIYG